MVGVTMRFSYPYTNENVDEYEIKECLSELSPEELLLAANRMGEPVSIDIEVYQ